MILMILRVVGYELTLYGVTRQVQLAVELPRKVGKVVLILRRRTSARPGDSPR
jgi:hypothetical protein